MHYTPAEAAALLQVSVWTIRRRIRDGVLPAQKYGPRTLRITDADLKAFMLRNRTVPPAELAVASAAPVLPQRG